MTPFWKLSDDLKKTGKINQIESKFADAMQNRRVESALGTNNMTTDNDLQRESAEVKVAPVSLLIEYLKEQASLSLTSAEISEIINPFKVVLKSEMPPMPTDGPA